MFKQDYILRQVDMMVQVIVKLIFSKDNVDYEFEDEQNLSACDYVFIKVKELLKQNNFCKAEDVLLNAIRENGRFEDKIYLNLALWFYNNLNKIDDDVLTENNYSREEIVEGLEKVCKIYNVDISTIMNI